MKLLENLKLRGWQLGDIDGELCFDRAVFDEFLAAPLDILPDFQGPPNFKLRRGRGKDHPRYGRFVYAFARHVRPRCVVEVGTFAGGTAVGWARALAENGQGRLICVDQDVYSTGTFPAVTRRNLARAGLSSDRFELRGGDSRHVVPALARELRGQVDVYLVDGDHTYDGALADIIAGLPMLRPSGFILVHDVDRGRRMDEATPEHPHPVYEAFHQAAAQHGLAWCILRFIRKHLGVLRLPSAAAHAA